jgi:hypothetical protein
LLEKHSRSKEIDRKKERNLGDKARKERKKEK